MKFRYYITDRFDCDVKGTNAEAVAKAYAASSCYIVVDSQEGVLLLESEEAYDIQEIDYN